MQWEFGVEDACAKDLISSSGKKPLVWRTGDQVHHQCGSVACHEHRSAKNNVPYFCLGKLRRNMTGLCNFLISYVVELLRNMTMLDCCGFWIVMDYYRLLILLCFHLWRMAYTTRNSDHRVSMVFLYLTLCSVACKLCKLQSLALHLWSITLSPSESQIVADVTGPGPSCRFETPSFGSGLVAPVLCQVP